MSKVKILNGKQTTDDYPYGRLRCTRSMWIEFAKGKGYRVVTQTVDPKTGRINAPKKGTYSTFVVLVESPETGYTESLHFSINGNTEIQRFQDFLRENGDQIEITTEQSAELYATIIASTRAGAQWTRFRKHEENETPTTIQYLEALQMKEIIKLYGAKANIMEMLKLDVDFVETLALYEDKENGEAAMSYSIRG